MSHRILFVPVSSPEGVGEYMRSLMIAQSLASQVSDVHIKFILSEQAPYAESCPYETHLCPASPTLHSDIVNNIIDEFKPNIVIFDASGRASQLKKAKQVGAYTIFFAQHDRKLRKGLKANRLRYTDKIFAVQPKELMQPIGLLNRLKIHMLSKASPEFVGPVFPVNLDDKKAVLEHYGLEEDNFIVISTGSGSHNVNGVASNTIFSEAANTISEKTSLKCVYVRGQNFQGEISLNTDIIDFASLAPKDFITLLSSARVAVLGGGGSLLQALAFNRPVVCAALAKDQHDRVEACAKFYGVSNCPPTSNAICEATLKALENQKDTSAQDYKIPLGLPKIVNHIKETLCEFHSE